MPVKPARVESTDKFNPLTRGHIGVKGIPAVLYFKTRASRKNVESSGPGTSRLQTTFATDRVQSGVG